jgi:hypothetical protein
MESLKGAPRATFVAKFKRDMAVFLNASVVNAAGMGYFHSEHGWSDQRPAYGSGAAYSSGDPSSPGYNASLHDPDYGKNETRWSSFFGHRRAAKSDLSLPVVNGEQVTVKGITPTTVPQTPATPSCPTSTTGTRA